MSDRILKQAQRYRRALWIYAASVTLGAGLFAVLTWFGVLAPIWTKALFAVLIVLSLLVIGAVMIWRHKIWVPTPEAEEKRALLAQLGNLHRGFQTRARSLSGRSEPATRAVFVTPLRHSDNGPCSLIEMGYTAFGERLEFGGMRLSTWGSQTGVAYRFELGPNATLSLEALGHLLHLIRKDHPPLPLNSLHVELDLARLGEDAESARQRRLANQIANQAVSILKVDLPLHVLLAGLENAPDLVRAASLTGAISEETMLGGFVDADAEDQDAAISEIFTQMAKCFDAARLVALKKQLAPQFCNALVAAPLQLDLLGMQLRPTLREVTAAMPPRAQALRLQSIIFLGTAPTERIVDPLAQISAQRFFGLPAVLASTGNKPESAVTKQHAASVAATLHMEAFSTRPNAIEMWRSRLRSMAVSLFLIGFVALWALTAYRDYRVFTPINADMSALFDRYFDAVSALAPGADDLVSRVLLLGDLRAGLARYDNVSFGGLWGNLSRSQANIFQARYEAELVGGFQMALQDHIEKDLFAFNALADGVSLFALALTEVQFHTDQSANADVLTRYFLSELAEQGEISVTFRSAFEATLGDLFTLNRPNALDRNSELNRVVARTLSGLDTAEMMYRTMLREPELARRVDLRAFAGPRFGEVFELTGPAQSYLIPNAFTSDGFGRVFLHGALTRMEASIRNYELLIGYMNPAQTNLLLQRVVELYTAEYIASWSRFLESLRIRDAQTLFEAQLLMTALGDSYENPLKLLVNSLQSNTVLAQIPPTGASGADAEAMPAVPVMEASGARAATKIAQSFRSYLAPVERDETLRTEFDILIGHARNVAQWIEAATTAASETGKFLFDEYADGTKVTPIAKLHQFAITSDINLIREFGTGLAVVLDRAAIALVTDYINDAWRNDIILPYGDLIASSFPFDPESSLDLSLETFSALFEPAQGQIRRFRETYLGRFEGPVGGFQQAATFLPFRTVEISPDTAVALAHSELIGRTMFREGQPALAFRLRVGQMDPGLSRLVVTSGVTLHGYSHGPVVWSDQLWPLAGLADSRIRLRIFNRSRLALVQEVDGPWSWFRLAQAGTRSVNNSLNLAQSRFGTDAMNASLQFNTTGAGKPFDPSFFTNLTLPEAIFP